MKIMVCIQVSWQAPDHKTTVIINFEFHPLVLPHNMSDFNGDENNKEKKIMTFEL